MSDIEKPAHESIILLTQLWSLLFPLTITSGISFQTLALTDFDFSHAVDYVFAGCNIISFTSTFLMDLNVVSSFSAITSHTVTTHLPRRLGLDALSSSLVLTFSVEGLMVGNERAGEVGAGRVLGWVSAVLISTGISPSQGKTSLSSQSKGSGQPRRSHGPPSGILWTRFTHSLLWVGPKYKATRLLLFLEFRGGMGVRQASTR